MPTLQVWLTKHVRALKRARRAARTSPPRKWKVVRGDAVRVVRGKDKGKEGVVKRVARWQGRVVVEGCNYHVRHVRMPGGEKGLTVRREAPVHVSNVALLDPTDNEPTRVAVRYLDDGTKVRVSKRSGAVIPKNDEVLRERRPRPGLNKERDTPKDAALKRTYFPSEAVQALLAKARAGELNK